MPLPEDDPNSGAPGWVVTYADMMTLLLAFFVLLYSISEIKEDRGNAMIQSLQRTFGRDAEERARAADSPEDSPLAQLFRAGRVERLETLRAGGKTRLLSGVPIASRSGEPLRTPADAAANGFISFAENSAELGEAARQRLEQLARQLAAQPQPILIRSQLEGPAGTVRGPYRSPWDLAYARCRRTLDYLVSQGISPQRLRLSVEPASEGASPSAPPSAGLGSRVEVAWRTAVVPGEPAAGPTPIR